MSQRRKYAAAIRLDLAEHTHPRGRDYRAAVTARAGVEDASIERHAHEWYLEFSFFTGHRLPDAALYAIGLAHRATEEVGFTVSGISELKIVECPGG